MNGIMSDNNSATQNTNKFIGTKRKSDTEHEEVLLFFFLPERFNNLLLFYNIYSHRYYRNQLNACITFKINIQAVIYYCSHLLLLWYRQITNLALKYQQMRLQIWQIRLLQW
ncbi:hypothetical protein BD770DRAFT_380428 [Pilaira anomala]|nr:hypothetical protein BD770DRAFT_380428 [Pilaira anomala]